MAGIIIIIILFLIIGAILKFVFSAAGFVFKFSFWIIGLALSVIGYIIRLGFLVGLGFFVVGVLVFSLSRIRR